MQCSFVIDLQAPKICVVYETRAFFIIVVKRGGFLISKLNVISHKDGKLKENNGDSFCVIEATMTCVVYVPVVTCLFS